VEKVRLLIVMRSEDDEIHDSLQYLRDVNDYTATSGDTYSLQLFGIFFYRFSIQDLPVMFAGF
jgi:hypothetical protein